MQKQKSLLSVYVDATKAYMLPSTMIFDDDDDDGYYWLLDSSSLLECQLVMAGDLMQRMFSTGDVCLA